MTKSNTENSVYPTEYAAGQPVSPSPRSIEFTQDWYEQLAALHDLSGHKRKQAVERAEQQAVHTAFAHYSEQANLTGLERAQLREQGAFSLQVTTSLQWSLPEGVVTERDFEAFNAAYRFGLLQATRAVSSGAIQGSQYLLDRLSQATVTHIRMINYVVKRQTYPGKEATKSQPYALFVAYDKRGHIVRAMVANSYEHFLEPGDFLLPRKADSSAMEASDAQDPDRMLLDLVAFNRGLKRSPYELLTTGSHSFLGRLKQFLTQLKHSANGTQKNSESLQECYDDLTTAFPEISWESLETLTWELSPKEASKLRYIVHVQNALSQMKAMQVEHFSSWFKHFTEIRHATQRLFRPSLLLTQLLELARLQAQYKTASKSIDVLNVGLKLHSDEDLSALHHALAGDKKFMGLYAWAQSSTPNGRILGDTFTSTLRADFSISSISEVERLIQQQSMVVKDLLKHFVQQLENCLQERGVEMTPIASLAGEAKLTQGRWYSTKGAVQALVRQLIGEMPAQQHHPKTVTWNCSVETSGEEAGLLAKMRAASSPRMKRKMQQWTTKSDSSRLTSEGRSRVLASEQSDSDEYSSGTHSPVSDQSSDEASMMGHRSVISLLSRGSGCSA